MNGDGIPELVNALGVVAFGKGNGKFEPPVTYQVEVSGPTGVALGDLRKNGLNDVVAGRIDATSVPLNKGKGKFSDGLWVPVPGANSCGASADFNGDGKPDLAIPTDHHAGHGKGQCALHHGSHHRDTRPGCPIAGDLNGDGIPDLLFFTSGGASAYLGNGDGTFTFASNTPINGGTLVLGDFNKDGKLDLASSSNQLALGNGDGTFRTPITIDPKPPEDGYDSIAAGDLNNDGWTDLVLTDYQDDALYVLLNDHHLGFIPSKVKNDNGPLVPVLADLNNDGNLDVVVMTFYGGLAAVYLGDGKGDLTLAQQLEYYGNPYGPLSVGDVNGDGIPDILLPSDADVQIALGNGDGTFQILQTNLGVGPGWGQILLQNLHGQSPKAGVPDMVSPDSTGGITVLINTTK